MTAAATVMTTAAQRGNFYSYRTKALEIASSARTLRAFRLSELATRAEHEAKEFMHSLQGAPFGSEASIKANACKTLMELASEMTEELVRLTLATKYHHEQLQPRERAFAHHISCI